MANVLLLDDSPVAQKALAGILGRTEHRLRVVDTVEEAWKFLLRNVAVDLLIVELKLKGGGQSMNLLRLLREHGYLKRLPVLAYTVVTDRESVRQALALQVQNYLIKPYHDDKVFAEEKRASDQLWRQTLFEEERSFCAQMGVSPEELRRLLERVRDQVNQLQPDLRSIIDAQSLDPCAEKLADLVKASEEAGFWGLFDVLQSLIAAVEARNWMRVQADLSAIALSEKLILHHLHPERIPPDFITQDEVEAAEQQRRRAIWLGGDVLASCPLVQWERVRAELDALQGFPVVQSVAAACEMTADGRETSVSPLGDLASRDPGLAAHVLQAVNAMQLDADDPVGDPQQAVQLLGGSRMRVLAAGIPMIADEDFRNPPLSWQSFWIYQNACAQVCAYICEFMEIQVFMPQAHWAGLLHDVGKMALVRLYPESLRAAMKLAREKGMSLMDAMHALMQCSHREVGEQLARRHRLPPAYANVMRYCGTPDEAGDDQELVALVTFASLLCRRYNMGFNGEPLLGQDIPLDELPGWSILRNRVFPSFDLIKFEAQFGRWATELRARLMGQGTAVVD